ncbi:TPA: hypothetical protein HA265_06540 [Candidatus Woesearchaeota archaeon]|nr:hypothetical protein [Candidatus Woesearchaeota archaeon]
MALREPESMDECVYYTQRQVDSGEVRAWVYRGDCPECGKAKMGKPRDDKTGKVKIRAKEYVCPECGYTAEKKEYEETLTCDIQYTCPACKNKGEISVPFKRKKFNGMDAVVFQCQKCKEKIPITKKMKSKGEPDDE